MFQIYVSDKLATLLISRQESIFMTMKFIFYIVSSRNKVTLKTLAKFESTHHKPLCTAEKEFLLLFAETSPLSSQSPKLGYLCCPNESVI